MDERAALDLVGGLVGAAGDDAAVVDGSVVTIDMLHEVSDFPDGTTRYTAGWRSIGASLSDVAAMGGYDPAAVAVYGAPSFEPAELEAFVQGASGVCRAVGGEYVGGDLDEHAEFTVASAAVGTVDEPVGRDGAEPGDVVVVTGTLGRSAAALAAFDKGDVERGNDLFQFEPRIAAGRSLAPLASAMMDSSDGLARSLHQLAEASGAGFAIDGDSIPTDAAVVERVAEPRWTAMTFGEDFELVATIPHELLDEAREGAPTNLSVIGEVVDEGVTLDGEPLADVGWTHGADDDSTR